jgi:hypothetical protein
MVKGEQDTGKARFIGAWTMIPGNLADISVGGGTVWGVNAAGVPYIWQNGGWLQKPSAPKALKRITVQADGKPWAVATTGEVYRWTGSAWTSVYGALLDIGYGGGKIMGNQPLG